MAAPKSKLELEVGPDAWEMVTNTEIIRRDTFAKSKKFGDKDKPKSPTTFAIAANLQALKQEVPEAYALQKKHQRIYNFKGPLGILTRQDNDYKSTFPGRTVQESNYPRHHTTIFRLGPFCRKFTNAEAMSKLILQTCNKLLAEFKKSCTKDNANKEEVGRTPTASKMAVRQKP